ncbi:TIGR04086 family membrane protein [Peptococcaceae bacterium 1198_IL3148]
MRPLKTEINNNQGPAISWTTIYKGTLITLVFSLLLSIIAGMVFYLTSLSENTLSWVASAILGISIFSGSFLAAYKVGYKGLYHGIGIGVLYFILVWIIAGLFLPSGVALAGFAIKFVISLIAGAIGGVIGVTLSA